VFAFRKVVEVTGMLEVTQEILTRIDPMLDAGDAESAGKLLVEVDATSLRALVIHILRERGTAVADAVGRAYLREHDVWVQARHEAA
jgi:hypothetical protein